MTLRGRYQYRDIDMMKCQRLLFRPHPRSGCNRQRIQPTIPFAAALFALMATATYVAAQNSERAPNDFERAYTVIALDMDSAELCGKISPNAVSRAPFNSPGTRVVAERSRCYFQVALKTLNPHHCGNVHQLGSRRQGVRRDYTEAFAWFKIAAGQGLEDAATARDAIAARLTPKQLADAARKIREAPHTAAN